MSPMDFKSLEEFKAFAAQKNAELGTAKAVFHPSEKGCQWCRAAGSCRALAEFNLNKARAVFSDDLEVQEQTLVKPDRLSDAELATLMDGIGLIESWAKQVREAALTAVKNGGTLPGYKLVRSKTRRGWSDTDSVEAALKSAGLDEKDIYEKKFTSPAQVEKKLGKKQFAKIAGDLVSKPVGREVLAPESDRREAIVTGGDVFDD